jgi:hypothetical protein
MKYRQQTITKEDATMMKQKDMENTMLQVHRRFMTGLDESIGMLDKDLDEAAEMGHICTDEWCKATEEVIDELHKNVYAISEPRWLTQEDSKHIRELRSKVKKLYQKFDTVST